MPRLELRKIIREEIAEEKRQLELKEARTSNTVKMLGNLTKSPDLEKRIHSSTILDGVVGLFRGKDGNAYEIVIRPAMYGKHKNLFRKFLGK